MKYKEEIIYDLMEIYIDNKDCNLESFKEIKKVVLTERGSLKQFNSISCNYNIEQIELLIYNFLRENN